MRKLAYGILALLLSLPTAALASSGCTYPTTHDLWTDKIAGDFLTIADVNQLRCAIEKLESGPVRPTAGSVTAPAFSFRDDSNTGIYSSGPGTLDFTIDGTARWRINATGHLVGTSSDSRILVGHTQTGGTAENDVVLKNTSSLRFLRSDASSATNYFIQGTSANNMEFRIPDGTDEYNFYFGTSETLVFQRQTGHAGIEFIGTGVPTDYANTAANTAVLFTRLVSTKMQFCARFPTGAAQCFAAEP